MCLPLQILFSIIVLIPYVQCLSIKCSYFISSPPCLEEAAAPADCFRFRIPGTSLRNKNCYAPARFPAKSKKDKKVNLIGEKIFFFKENGKYGRFFFIFNMKILELRQLLLTLSL